MHPSPVTDEEKAFGIIHKKQTTGSLLRNWLTFQLRECITQEERAAFASQPNLEKNKEKIRIGNTSQNHSIQK